jgi:cation:H+ antiporter
VIHVVLLVSCAVAIYLSCEWFVNAIEWLGVRMRIGGMAVGTILAAAGTALPESVVTLMAVLFGSKENGNDIAVGAAMGGPLVVGTIAYAVTGGMLLLRLRHRREVAVVVAHGNGAGDERQDDVVDTQRLARDQVWFLSIFAVKVALGLVAFAIKPWLGLLFLVAYGIYFYKEMTDDGEDASADDLEPLKLRPKSANPATWAVAVQTLGSLVVIFVASQIFVEQLEWAGPALGLPAVVVALLLSPIATELPEIMNAVIWVRQGKANLALANISGSMMIQATVPSAIGIGFTTWKFDAPLMLAGFATLASVAYLLWVMKRGRFTPTKLLLAGGFYLVFAAGLVLTV